VSNDSTGVQVWRVHPSYRINSYIPMALAVWIALFAMTRIGTTRTIVIAAAGVAALLLMVQAVWAIRRQASIEVVLSADDVVNKKSGSIDRIPLPSISGVVVTKRSLARDTWTTWLMTDDGGAFRLGAPAFVFLSRHKALVRPDAAYWASVARSSSGRQASAIYEAALRAQADDGSLVTAVALAEQMAEREPLASATGRFWSPNGETS
jgi:hypothetical protein